MTDREISEEEGLEIIQSMVVIARDKLQNEGFHFIMWGLLVILASIIIYFLNYFIQLGSFYWVWGLVPIIGIPIAFYYERKKNKIGKNISRFEKLYKYLWLGFSVTLMALIFLSIINKISPLAFILSLVGFAVFIAGKIIDYRPLVYGSVIVWGCAILCPYLNENNQLLLNAAALLFGYVIPGIGLSQKNKQSV